MYFTTLKKYKDNNVRGWSQQRAGTPWSCRKLLRGSKPSWGLRDKRPLEEGLERGEEGGRELALVSGWRPEHPGPFRLPCRCWGPQGASEQGGWGRQGQDQMVLHTEVSPPRRGENGFQGQAGRQTMSSLPEGPGQGGRANRQSACPPLLPAARASHCPA